MYVSGCARVEVPHTAVSTAAVHAGVSFDLLISFIILLPCLVLIALLLQSEGKGRSSDSHLQHNVLPDFKRPKLPSRDGVYFPLQVGIKSRRSSQEKPTENFPWLNLVEAEASSTQGQTSTNMLSGGSRPHARTRHDRQTEPDQPLLALDDVSPQRRGSVLSASKHVSRVLDRLGRRAVAFGDEEIPDSNTSEFKQLGYSVPATWYPQRNKASPAASFDLKTHVHPWHKFGPLLSEAHRLAPEEARRRHDRVVDIFGSTQRPATTNASDVRPTRLQPLQQQSTIRPASVRSESGDALFPPKSPEPAVLGPASPRSVSKDHHFAKAISAYDTGRHRKLRQKAIDQDSDAHGKSSKLRLAQIRNDLQKHKAKIKAIDAKQESRIRALMDTMPIPFLLNYSVDSEYIRERVREMLRPLFAYLNHFALAARFRQWRHNAEQLSSAARFVDFKKAAGIKRLAAFIELAVKEQNLRRKRRAMEQMKRVVAFEKYKEQLAAVLVLQRNVRGLLGRRAFKRMNLARDSATMIQAVWRAFYPHWWWKLLRAAPYPIQAFWRGVYWKNLFPLLRAASPPIQTIWRGYFHRSRYRAAIRAAVVIQTHLRGHWAQSGIITILRARSYERMSQRLWGALEIQRWLRGIRARYRVHLIRKTNERESMRLYNAALRLQRQYYARNGEFSSFALCCALRISHEREMEERRHEALLDRWWVTYRLQLKFRGLLRRRLTKTKVRLTNAAIKVQRRVRGHRRLAATRQLLAKIRVATRCQRLLRAKLARRENAATKIQVWMWWSSAHRAKRRVLHKVIWDSMQHALNQHIQRSEAATRCQAAFRAHYQFEWYREYKAARTIQCAGRGLLARRLLARIKRQIRLNVAAQWLTSLFAEVVPKVAPQVLAERSRMASRMQTCIRRWILWRKVLHRRFLNAKATDIQRAYAGMRGRWLFKYILARHRFSQKNIFRKSRSVLAVLAKYRARTKWLYDPNDGKLGESLVRYLRRYGFGDLADVLATNGVGDVPSLKQLDSAEKLRNAGVQDGDVIRVLLAKHTTNNTDINIDYVQAAVAQQLLAQKFPDASESYVANMLALITSETSDMSVYLFQQLVQKSSSERALKAAVSTALGWEAQGLDPSTTQHSISTRDYDTRWNRHRVRRYCLLTEMALWRCIELDANIVLGHDFGDRTNHFDPLQRLGGGNADLANLVRELDAIGRQYRTADVQQQRSNKGIADPDKPTSVAPSRRRRRGTQQPRAIVDHARSPTDSPIGTANDDSTSLVASAATKLAAKLESIVELDKCALNIQRVFRGATSRRVTNRMLIEDRARRQREKEEREERERQEAAAAAEAEKQRVAEVQAYLNTICSLGWQERVDEFDGVFFYNEWSGESRTGDDRPTYSVKEYDLAQRVQRQLRMLLAKRKLARLKWQRIRDAQREKRKLQWDETEARRGNLYHLDISTADGKQYVPPTAAAKPSEAASPVVPTQIVRKKSSASRLTVSLRRASAKSKKKKRSPRASAKVVKPTEVSSVAQASVTTPAKVVLLRPRTPTCFDADYKAPVAVAPGQNLVGQCVAVYQRHEKEDSEIERWFRDEAVKEAIDLVIHRAVMKSEEPPKPRRQMDSVFAVVTAAASTKKLSKKAILARQKREEARLLRESFKKKLSAAAYVAGGVDFESLFKHYDRDNSGELDCGEFISAMRRDAKLSTKDFSDELLTKIFLSVDVDGSGEIDADEFITWMEQDSSTNTSKQDMLKPGVSAPFRSFFKTCQSSFATYLIENIFVSPQQRILGRPPSVLPKSGSTLVAHHKTKSTVDSLPDVDELDVVDDANNPDTEPQINDDEVDDVSLLDDRVSQFLSSLSRETFPAGTDLSQVCAPKVGSEPPTPSKTLASFSMWDEDEDDDGEGTGNENVADHNESAAQSPGVGSGSLLLVISGDYDVELYMDAEHEQFEKTIARFRSSDHDNNPHSVDSIDAKGHLVGDVSYFTVVEGRQLLQPVRWKTMARSTVQAIRIPLDKLAAFLKPLADLEAASQHDHAVQQVTLEWARESEKLQAVADDARQRLSAADLNLSKANRKLVALRARHAACSKEVEVAKAELDEALAAASSDELLTDDPSSPAHVDSQLAIDVAQAKLATAAKKSESLTKKLELANCAVVDAQAKVDAVTEEFKKADTNFRYRFEYVPEPRRPDNAPRDIAEALTRFTELRRALIAQRATVETVAVNVGPSLSAGPVVKTTKTAKSKVQPSSDAQSPGAAKAPNKSKTRRKRSASTVTALSPTMLLLQAVNGQLLKSAKEELRLTRDQLAIFAQPCFQQCPHTFLIGDRVKLRGKEAKGPTIIAKVTTNALYALTAKSRSVSAEQPSATKPTESQKAENQKKDSPASQVSGSDVVGPTKKLVLDSPRKLFKRVRQATTSQDRKAIASLVDDIVSDAVDQSNLYHTSCREQIVELTTEIISNAVHAAVTQRCEREAKARLQKLESRWISGVVVDYDDSDNSQRHLVSIRPPHRDGRESRIRANQLFWFDLSTTPFKVKYGHPVAPVTLVPDTYAPRFKWKMVPDDVYPTEIYFWNSTIQESSWALPGYTFEENEAATHLQRLFRGRKGRQSFVEKARSLDVYKTILTTLRAARSAAWIGYGAEGLDLHMWLLRLGLGHTVDLFRSYFASDEHKMATAGRKGASGRTSSASSSPTHRKARGWEHVAACRYMDVQFLMDSVGLDAEDARWLRRCTSSVAAEEKALALVVGETESIAFSPAGVSRRISTGPRIEFGRFFSNQALREQGFVEGTLASSTPIALGAMQAYLRKYTGKPKLAVEMIEHELAGQPFVTKGTSVARCFLELHAGFVACARLFGALGIRPLQQMAREFRQPFDAIAVLLRGGQPIFLPAGSSAAAVQQAASDTTKAATANLSTEVQIAISDQPRYFLAADGSRLQMFKSNLWDPRFCSPSTGDSPVDKVHVELLFFAALQLRQYFQHIRHILDGVIFGQAVARGFIQRSKFRAFMGYKFAMATKIQTRWRMVLATRFRDRRYAMRYSPWEQCKDDEYDTFFYYNTETDETSWTEPPNDQPYKPFGWWPEPTVEEVAEEPVGMCPVCSDRKATRHCPQCDADYCFKCFVDAHSETRELLMHKYEPIIIHVPHEYLDCKQCSRFATRWIYIQTREPRSRGPAAGRPPGPVTQGTKPAGGKKFDHKLVPGQASCQSCYEDIQLKHYRTPLRYTEYRAGHPVCIQCNERFAHKECHDCDGDVYCDGCFDEVHRKGRRRVHKFKLIRETLPPAVPTLRVNSSDNTAAEGGTEGSVEKSSIAARAAAARAAVGHKYCDECDFGIARHACPWCHGVFCNGCNVVHPHSCDKHPDIDSAVIQGSKVCFQCGQPASRECRQCKRHFCSHRWFGNPGCFESYHNPAYAPHLRSHVWKPHPAASIQAAATTIQKYVRRFLVTSRIRRHKRDRSARVRGRLFPVFVISCSHWIFCSCGVLVFVLNYSYCNGWPSGGSSNAAVKLFKYSEPRRISRCRLCSTNCSRL